MEVEESEAEGETTHLLEGSGSAQTQPVSVGFSSHVCTETSAPTVQNPNCRTLHMLIPFTEPPRQQFITHTLPSIQFPKLSFVDPRKLKPIDLSGILPVTNMTLDTDVANRIQEMNTCRMMFHVPGGPRSKEIVPVSYCRNQLRLARKQVLSRIGIPSWSEERKLLTAVRSADISTVQRLLDDGFDPNSSDSKKRTALHIAASQGLHQLVSCLVAAKADPNRQDILGNTPLHLAVCRGDTCTVNILLRSGADISLRDNVGRTPLCIVRSRLGTLRQDKSISTDKLISECQMISDILKVHCMQQTEVDTSTPGGLSSSTVDELCSMIKTISTREHADEVADTMIEKMSHLHIVHNEQVQKNMKQTYKPHFIL